MKINTKEISVRVAKAVDEIHKATRIKNMTYDELAEKIEVIAEKYDLTVDFIRTVSGVEFTNINNIIKYHRIGSEKQFNDNYKKLSKTDKARVDQAISEMEVV